MRMMVGRPIDQVFPKRDVPIGEVVLTVEGLSNATEYADISFDLRKGEILGPLWPGRRRPLRGDAGPVRHQRRMTRGTCHAERQPA